MLLLSYKTDEMSMAFSKKSFVWQLNPPPLPQFYKFVNRKFSEFPNGFRNF